MHDLKKTPSQSSTASMEHGVMRLRILLPEGILIDQVAAKVSAEATNGSFTLLPRHIDFVAPIAAGVMLLTGQDGVETVIGTDDGTLVKIGRDVRVVTRRAVVGTDLQSLRETVDTQFRSWSEREATLRQALAGLEVGIARRFIELEERS